MEIYEPPDKEFETVVLKMLKRTQTVTKSGKYRNKISPTKRKPKNQKKKNLELENTIITPKNSVESFNSRPG